MSRVRCFFSTTTANLLVKLKMVAIFPVRKDGVACILWSIWLFGNGLCARLPIYITFKVQLTMCEVGFVIFLHDAREKWVTLSWIPLLSAHVEQKYEKNAWEKNVI